MRVDLSQGRWVNEPSDWRLDGGDLVMTTDDRTDFWRETHYGFTRDNGHFLGVPAGESFTATLRVQGEFRRLYDQAGLMIRLDATRWVKTGVEFSDGEAFLSTVVTDGKSDWSVAKLFAGMEDFWIRATVDKGALRVQASADGTVWPLARLAPFPAAPAYEVGPTACTPERAGLTVRFSAFTLEPATTKDLHDLS